MTNASVQTTAGLERRMEVQVPAARIQQEVDRRLLDVGRTARLDGFRPGKVPAAVIRKRFGEQVHREVIDDLVRRSFAEAVVEQKLAPAGGPRIEPVSTLAGQDLKYTAVFEVYPEIELRGLDKLKVERPVTEVTEKDVDAMLEHLRKQLMEWKTAAAQQQKAQQPAEVSATEPAPAEAPSEEALSDEEFSKAYGVTEGGIVELRRQIAENMRQQVEQTVETKMRSNVLDQLLEANPLDLPKALVEAQISDMQVDLARRTGIREVAQLPPREKFLEPARRRVALGLLIGEIVKTEKIEPDPAKVQSRLEAIVASAHNAHGHHHADPEEHRRHEQEMVQAYRQDAQALQQIEALVLEDQVVEGLLARAKVTEQRKSFKELTNFGAQP